MEDYCKDCKLPLSDPSFCKTCAYGIDKKENKDTNGSTEHKDS